MHLEFLKISHKKSDLSFPKDRSFSRLKVQFLYEFYFDFIPYGNCALSVVFCCTKTVFVFIIFLIAALHFHSGRFNKVGNAYGAHGALRRNKNRFFTLKNTIDEVLDFVLIRIVAFDRSAQLVGKRKTA